MFLRKFIELKIYEVYWLFLYFSKNRNCQVYTIKTNITFRCKSINMDVENSIKV